MAHTLKKLYETLLSSKEKEPASKPKVHNYNQVAISYLVDHEM